MHSDAGGGPTPFKIHRSGKIRTSFRNEAVSETLACLCSGVELLLDEIYDTIFAGLDLASTFAETTLYRILQRRFLAVQLVLSGRFRCE